MKYVVVVVVVVSFLILISLNTFAKSTSLVKKDEWGSGRYRDAVLVGDYLYAISDSGHLDVIAPHKTKKEQLVNHIKISQYGSSDLDVYKGFISLNANSQVIYYDLADPINPKKVFDFSIVSNQTVNQKATDENYHYVVAQNQLYIISYTEESGFEIKKVVTLDDLQSHGVGSFQIYVENDVMFIHYSGYTYNENNEIDYYYTVLEYDISDLANITLNSKATIDDVDSSKKIAYVGEHHFAVSSDSNDSIRIYQAKNNQIELISESPASGGRLEGIHWQKETNKLRVIFHYNWYTYSLSSFENPTLESNHSVLKENRILNIYQFLSSNTAIARGTYVSELSIIDLDEASVTNALYDQSGSFYDIATGDNSIYAIKGRNLMTLNVDEAKLEYINSVSGGELNKIIRTIDVKDNQLYLASNGEVSIYDLANTGSLEHQFDVSIPTTSYGYITRSVANENDQIFMQSQPLAVTWYDISEPFSILTAPLSFDIASYLIEEQYAINHVRKLYLVDGFLVMHVNAQDNKEYLLLVENNGQSLDVVDVKYINYSFVNGFFAANQFFYEVVRNSNKLTAYAISDEGKFTVNNTLELNVESSSDQVLNGYFWQDYLVIQTKQLIQLYDVQPGQLVLLDEVESMSTNLPELVFNTVNDKLVVSDIYGGELALYELNLAPVSQSQFEIDEDTNFDINELFNDPEGDEISYEIIIAPEHGEITTPDGIYTPNQDYYGEDNFTVKVADVHGNYIEQEVTASVLPVNDVPVIGTTEVAATEDTQLVELLAITDADGDQLSYALDEQPTHGVASLNEQGELTYTPEADYFGRDSVTVVVTDIHGVTATGVIAISVASVNDLPKLVTDTFEGTEDNTIEGQLKATDIEGQALSFSVVADSAVNGQVSVQTDGSFVFIPTDNFFGQASFIAQVTDIEQGVTQQTITISIAGADDAPVAESVTTSINHNGSFTGSFESSDVDGDSLQYTLVNDVTNGTLSLSADGSYSYTPNNGYSGSDSFTYEVTDGNNNAQGTITFSVQAAPVVETKKTSNGGSGGGSIGYMLLMLLLGLFRCQRQEAI